MQGDATADGFGNDVCKVEPEEPGIADDGTVVYIANYCLRYVLVLGEAKIEI